MTPARIESIDPYDWAEILSASRAEDHHMVSRLVADFRAGRNRFDAPGEVLVLHLCGNRVVGVAGLNRERDTSFGKAGRVRRLYVIPRERSRGLGLGLVERIVASARAHFDVLTVNVGDLDAGGFYEHLGFRPVDHAEISHVKELARGPSIREQRPRTAVRGGGQGHLRRRSAPDMV